MPASAKKNTQEFAFAFARDGGKWARKGGNTEVVCLFVCLFQIEIFLFRILNRRTSQRWRAKGSERGTMGINTISIAEATLIRCLGPARSNT